MGKIRFGTDGWRGVMSEDFTFDNVRLVAQAIADYVKNERRTSAKPPRKGTNECEASPQGDKRLVVGYDTRFLSDEFARTVSEVLAGNDIKVLLSNKPTPTPLVSFTIKNRRLNGGVMVTASHNPPRYNGIKFKADYAGPAGPSITKEIESFIGKSKIKSMLYDRAHKRRLIECLDLDSGYLKLLKGYLDMDLLKKKRFNVLVDVMHGVGNGYVARLLKGTPSKVDTIHDDRNPTFLGTPPEPIEKNLKEMISMVKKGKYDIGLGIDGDADRIGAVRPDGRFVSSGEIIALLALHFYEDKRWRGAIAKTISGTSLINKIAKKYKLRLYETPVGFKHICKLMLKESILVGGEESGGIGFMNYIPERDGTLAGLLLLEMMAYRKKEIIEIMDDVEKEFGRHHYIREDLSYPDNMKKKLFLKLGRAPLKELLKVKVTQTKTYDGRKFIAEDGSWILFRLSGTEPILRIYAEALSGVRVKALMEFGKRYAFSL